MAEVNGLNLNGHQSEEEGKTNIASHSNKTKNSSEIVTVLPSQAHTYSSKNLKTQEKQIVTLYPKDSKASTPTHSSKIILRRECEQHSNRKGNNIVQWKDKVLKKLEGKASGPTLLWLPGSGRHVSEGPDSYQTFTHISRTLHLDVALEVCSTWRIPPKNIISFSSIDSRDLPPTHPCSSLKVLWFSANTPNDDEDKHDWYGNVEFTVNASILLECWKYSYLVEMMTTPTHTTSRILLTNTDFSDVLLPYSPFRAGGPWQVTAENQLVLYKCSRYRFKGNNRHPHIVEFLLDVTKKDEKKILRSCQLSFKNHVEAQNLEIKHVCNRHQRAKTVCPSPFPKVSAAEEFAAQIMMRGLSIESIPRLSLSAQQLYKTALDRLINSAPPCFVPVPTVVLEGYPTAQY